jgi:predicted helicase
MKKALFVDSQYEFKKIYIWCEFPHKNDLNLHDFRIDLVCKTKNGEYWAAQYKLYDEKPKLVKMTLTHFWRYMSILSKNLIAI